MAECPQVDPSSTIFYQGAMRRLAYFGGKIHTEIEDPENIGSPCAPSGGCCSLRTPCGDGKFNPEGGRCNKTHWEEIAECHQCPTCTSKAA